MHVRTKAAILFVLSAFLGTFGFRLSLPAVAFYTRDILEFSFLGIGLLTSVFFLARTVMGLYSGMLTDKYSTRILFASGIAFILHGVTILLYPIANSMLFVLLIRFLQGIFNGMGWIPVQVFMGKIIPHNLRGRVYSVYFILGSIGGLFSNGIYSLVSSKNLISILLVSTFSLSIVGIMVIIAYIMIAREVPIEKKLVDSSSVQGNIGDLSRVLRDILLLVVLVFSSGLISSLVNGDLIYIYLKEALEISKSMTALLLMISGILALPINYTISWLSDKDSSNKALRLSMFLIIIGGTMLSSSIKPIVILGIGFLVSGISSIIPVARKIAVSRKSGYGTAIGLVNSFGNIGSVTGALMTGFILDAMGVDFIKIGDFMISEGLTIIVLPTITILLFIYIILFHRDNKRVWNTGSN